MAPFPRACLRKAGAVGRFLAIEVSPDNYRNPLDLTDKPRLYYPHNINLDNSFCLILETDTMA